MLPGTYAICRLDPNRPPPAYPPPGPDLVSVTFTQREISVVCPEEQTPSGARTEAGWRVLEVAGPLDLALTGVMASLIGPLSDAGVSVFAVSTYDTDFLLVRGEQVGHAARCLRHAGHRVVT